MFYPADETKSRCVRLQQSLWLHYKHRCLLLLHKKRLVDDFLLMLDLLRLKLNFTAEKDQTTRTSLCIVFRTD